MTQAISAACIGQTSREKTENATALRLIGDLALIKSAWLSG
jgi:hypothetical protein